MAFQCLDCGNISAEWEMPGGAPGCPSCGRHHFVTVAEGAGLTAHGVDGQVELVGDVIRLSRSGLNALFSQGVKEIFIDDISSIQLKEAGFMRGYIQFAFRGGLEAKGGVFEAAADENTVLFTKDQQPAFLQMKAAIDQRRGELRRPAAQVGTAVEPPDDLVAQLERLTALHTSGALSDADFDAAKRKVLGT